MVLAELGQRISRALGSLNSVTVVDEAVSLPPLPPARPLLPSARSVCACASCALLCWVYWTKDCSAAAACGSVTQADWNFCRPPAGGASLAAVFAGQCVVHFFLNCPFCSHQRALHLRWQVLDACLKEIATALLQADVNVRLVANLRNNVKKRVNMEQLASGLNKQKVIEKVGAGAAGGTYCVGRLSAQSRTARPGVCTASCLAAAATPARQNEPFAMQGCQAGLQGGL